jgi:hypothetical protein
MSEIGHCGRGTGLDSKNGDQVMIQQDQSKRSSGEQRRGKGRSELMDHGYGSSIRRKRE